MRVIGIVALVGALAGVAGAQSDEWLKQDREQRAAENWKSGREQLDAALTHPAPGPGLETAPVRAPAWCGVVKNPPHHNPGSIRAHLEQVARNGTIELILAAPGVCDEPNEPVYQRAAAEIEQLWINQTGLSEKQAIESIKARIDAPAFEAAKKQLCDALTVSDEIAGELRMQMGARRDLFECGGAMQRLSIIAPMGLLLPYLDASATEPDELVRLALVSGDADFTVGGSEGLYRDKHLAAYTTDQYDYKALAPDKLEKLVETDPYRGNLYARTVVHEKLAHARMQIAAIETAVTKHATDDDWKELLLTAPRRGFAAWSAGIAPWKEALGRSNELEMKAFGPSRKAMAGCLPPLRKDISAVMKTLKHGSVEELRQQMSDHPAAGLLMKRLILCMAADGDATVASSMRTGFERVRVTRGPRSMAYFAALDALNKIHDDRDKFPVDVRDLPSIQNSVVDELISNLISKRQKDPIGYMDIDSHTKGIVKSVQKSAQGIKVTFEAAHHQEMGRSCVDTNHILQFRADGSPLYQQKCRDTGLFSVNDTPAPIEVPSELAEGIAPGRLVVFYLVRGAQRSALPMEVYVDKSKKKLAAYYGFGLQ